MKKENFIYLPKLKCQNYYVRKYNIISYPLLWKNDYLIKILPLILNTCFGNDLFNVGISLIV